jgi:hypothetical protein
MNTRFDFYYSEKQNEYSKKIFSTRAFFKGVPYTERVLHGSKPSGNFIDYKFLGTGDDDDCKFV